MFFIASQTNFAVSLSIDFLGLDVTWKATPTEFFGTDIPLSIILSGFHVNSISLLNGIPSSVQQHIWGLDLPTVYG